MISGYDVSGYQAAQFPVSGADFAIIKITEGATFTNTKWLSQRTWSRDHGLVTGFYHFARPGSMLTQADFFLSRVNLRPGDILAFDWEDSGVSSAQKDEWIHYVRAQRPDHRVLLYCNTYFWKNLDHSSFAGDGLWIATGGIPAGSPPVKADWLIHQYSTAGGIDHNVARFETRDAMRTWALRETGTEQDMALTDADKAWIKEVVYGATLGRDAVRSPDDAPANPTWQAASYLRESYLRLRENQELLKEIKALLTGAVLADPAVLKAQVKAAIESISLQIKTGA